MRYGHSIFAFQYIKALLAVISTILIVNDLTGQEKRGFEIWNLNSISGNITAKDIITLNEKIHYSVDEKETEVKYGEILIRHKSNHLLSYGTGFRMVQINIPDGLMNEKRPMVFAVLEKKLGKYKLNLINRIEYRFLDKIPDHFRNVERLDIISPSVTPMNLSLFFAGEFFTKFNTQNLHLQRYYAGFKAFDSSHFNLRLYYALQREKEVNAKLTTDIMGINLGFIL